MCQDDPPYEDPLKEDQSKGGDEAAAEAEEPAESFMYFIRTGQFRVKIKQNFRDDRDVEGAPRDFETQLYDGDHFGEIGLIFDANRTATVQSTNYGSLARLREGGFKALQQQFKAFTTQFKYYIFKYKDDLRAFLEMECDKISYFKDVDMVTKQELLFNMERKTYLEGAPLFSRDDVVDRLVVIQSGIVELSVLYDNRVNGENFTVERLIPGAILNHQAFIMKKKPQIDYVCLTPVSCFELSYDRMKKVMNERADLRTAREELKEKFNMYKYPVALDYILHNFAQTKDEYEDRLLQNKSRVAFKNAVMQVWAHMKESNFPRDIWSVFEKMKKRKDEKN